MSAATGSTCGLTKATFPGRRCVGDVLRITLINDMPPNRDPVPDDHVVPHHFNTTNFHSHGLHVSPSGISDNVMRMMEPGQSYDIEIAIPSDHIPGTNWYHPHMHGSADVQIASGAVGALIIEGDFTDVPEIAAAITMRPGEVQRLRILHAGWQDDIFMELEGHKLISIARDGIPLSRMGLSVPIKPDQPTDHPNAMLMAPGQRLDVLV